jgi:hypothetical protein
MPAITPSSSSTPVLVGDPQFLIDEGVAPGEAVLMYGDGIDLMLVEIDNSSNTTAVYLKLFDNNDPSLVQLGTTPPEAQFVCPATSTVTYSMSTAESESSMIFHTGIVYTILTVAGTEGTANDLPEASPTIKMMGEQQ